jgi:amino acid transporter
MFSLARSGMLPAWFGKLHSRYGTPYNALLFIGALSFLAPFFGVEMLVWLVDSGAPSIVLAYTLVAISFLILRRREPEMDRPLRIGGKGKGGIWIGVAAAMLGVALFSLYMPGMPAQLGVEPWVLFGLWWVIGLMYYFRVPAGIKPGPLAEEHVLERVRSR